MCDFQLKKIGSALSPVYLTLLSTLYAWDATHFCLVVKGSWSLFYKCLEVIEGLFVR
jgi:hypothetical protein